MNKNFYITSPIYYVNDAPHIGHAYTSIACDVVARYKRMEGYDVLFLTGTDEHGQKVEKAAENKKLAPQEFVDEVSQKFVELSDLLNLSNDDFIRTTEERHKACAINIWNRLVENGFIYLGKYSGWYSTRDEAFFLEKDLIDGKAPTGAPVEWIEEPSYFFALSKFQDKLLEFYQENPSFIEPQSRFNEIVSFVKSGLLDLSISRTSFSWGIKIPNEPEHVMYVWLDALTNYLSALGYPDTKNPLFNKFWPADLHVVGKDILRFHAVYWPAFLMAAGLALPKKIIAHGWWTIDGEKMSKSIGNVIAPKELIEKFGIDQTRYFLMREIAFGNDGNFSKASMANRVNSELANNIGNLAQRTLSFINKNANASIPEVNVGKLYKEPILAELKTSIANYKKYMDELKFNLAIEEILDISTKANIFIDEQAPWKLKNSDSLRMNEVLYILCELLRHIAILFSPLMPDSMNKLLDQLSVDNNKRKTEFLNEENALENGLKLPNPQGIFPRITT